VRTDRKVTCVKWACGSRPASCVVIGPARGALGLGGLSDGDVEAECLDLAYVVAELAVGVGAGLVVAVAEVGVAGFGAGEQVPNDDQDGACDGDLGGKAGAARVVSKLGLPSSHWRKAPKSDGPGRGAATLAPPSPPRSGTGEPRAEPLVVTPLDRKAARRQ
jgi:hypothetical protein